ncbi:trypsin-like serine peptidase [Phytohabitans houttuyneae]|uniref:Peptidase n=1 Tax=Phytohabitans houttuyneae TaxID=1076126 RepID=A0A6V8KEF8_9ACTN|nr:hypothetical protein [Phytohabitans houttuyneae]GFJ81820.1 peptidase [Phytohabitans houttuyneae]
MLLTDRRGALLLAIAVAVAVGAQAAPALAGSAPTDTGRPVQAEAELTPDARVLGPDPATALRAYWTEERMAAAEPVAMPALTREELERLERPTVGEPGMVTPRDTRPGSRAPEESAIGDSAAPWPWRGDAPATTVGRVFFYDVVAKKDKTCSAAVVDSEGRNLVWTAGHCVHGGKNKKWHENWVFKPHYHNGTDWNFGVWHAIWKGTWSKWINDSNHNFDFGAVQVARNGWGQNIVDVTGAQGIAWNYPANQYVHNFGYPGEYPFNGQILRYCHGSAFDNHHPGIGMMCNMNGGSSGGPWLGWFNGWNGWINGNNSYKVTLDPTRIYSPYFGNEVFSLYNTMRWG